MLMVKWLVKPALVSSVYRYDSQNIAKYKVLEIELLKWKLQIKKTGN